MNKFLPLVFGYVEMSPESIWIKSGSYMLNVPQHPFERKKEKLAKSKALLRVSTVKVLSIIRIILWIIALPHAK
jgi:hypothetical protein